MRIIKIGGFDKEGCLTGWHVGADPIDAPNSSMVSWDGLFIDEGGRVRVGGIEIIEWTEARKKAMEK